MRNAGQRQPSQEPGQASLRARADRSAADRWATAPCFTARWTGDRYETSGEPVAGMGYAPGVGDESATPQAEWRWHGDRLVASNDRFGHQPLFYACAPRSVAISPSIPRLVAAGAPTELDYCALGVFLRLGVFIGEETPFAAIRALPPNGELVWDRQGPHVTGCPTIIPAQRISRDAALDGYVERMRASVRKRLPRGGQRAVVPMSGGADSRHILLELLAAGVERPWCPTMRMFPPRRDEDAAETPRIAADLDVDHEVIAQARSRFAAEIDKHWRTSFCSITLTWSLPMIDRFRRVGDVVYDGLGGDVLSAGVDQTWEWYRLSQEGRWPDVANLVVRDNEPMLEQLLSKDAYRRMPRPAALERIAAELRRHADAANPLGSFMFYNENRRNLTLRPNALFSQAAEVVFTPYLDDDVVAHLASLPAPMTARSMDGLDFHTDAIRRAHPDRPQWPYSYTMTDVRRGRSSALPPADDRAHFRRFAIESLAYVSGRRRSHLIDRTRLVPRLVHEAARGRQNYGRNLFALYLIELERLASGRAPGDTGSRLCT